MVVPARYDQLRRITAFVRKLASKVGFDQTHLNRIELAVDEACSNIIQHAYAGVDNGLIRIDVHVEPHRKLVIVLTDTGRAFDPDSVEQHDPVAAAEELKIGGLGLYLMRQTMDDVHFEFGLTDPASKEPHKFNRLTLTKYI